MKISLRKLTTWKPTSKPGSWRVGIAVGASAAGCIAFLLGLFVLDGLVLAPAAVLFGLIATLVFGFISIKLIQTSIQIACVQRCLRDGKATYLMPGAYTHVLSHPDLPRHVLLVKRASSSNQGAPRQTMDDEWKVYTELSRQELAAKTERVCKIRMSDISLRLGGNLNPPAIKGEERFVADRDSNATVAIWIQERGIPLSDLLAKCDADEKRSIYASFRDVIHQIWKCGFIDLDVAFRNYLVRVDSEGDPITNQGGLAVLEHDFGCIFQLENPKDVSKFLDQRGPAGEYGQANISNGAFLMRSLTGRLESDFAQELVPDAEWAQLKKLFADDNESAPLAQRLKHHSNYKMLRRAHQAFVSVITDVVATD